MTLDEILGEARSAVAQGRAPDWTELRDRIGSLELEERARREALHKLDRIGAVDRARRSRRPPAEAAKPVSTRRLLLRARPTLSGTIDLRRERAGDAYVLAWDADRAVETWELRISEQRDARGGYETVETRTLPGETTSAGLPLGEAMLRVHLLGRGRGGRLVRRAIASGLTPESWGERWTRRPSAA